MGLVSWYLQVDAITKPSVSPIGRLWMQLNLVYPNIPIFFRPPDDCAVAERGGSFYFVYKAVDFVRPAERRSV